MQSSYFSDGGRGADARTNAQSLLFFISIVMMNIFSYGFISLKNDLKTVKLLIHYTSFPGNE